jgi:hypothetical protein
MHRKLAIGLAAAALLALPAVAAAEETPRRPAGPVHPTQTCSRPSTCETDAAARVQAVRTLGLRGDLDRLYRPYEALDRHYRPTGVAAVATPAGGGFDWGDAGVGAGVGFGLALVGGGSVLAIRRRAQARSAHP